MITKKYKTSLFEVSLWESCVIAALVVVVGYILILPLAHQTLVGRVFVKSAWIGELIAFLGVWSLVIIVMKAIGLKYKRMLLEEDLLPEAIGTRITTSNAHKFARYLQSRFHGGSIHLVSKRLQLALERVALGHASSEIVQDLQTQSQVDVDELESSYTMIRTFIWAIPILGFIGTVLGIGQAIGGFAESLQSAEDMATVKSTLGHVVRGLAFAFDTTFLGLLVSLIVMFPMSVIHRAEQSLLNTIDEYHAQHLGRRIQTPTMPSGLSMAVLKSLTEGKPLEETLSVP